MVKSILIVGVGGQGSLLTGKILGDLLMNEGYDVKLSEVHGMAQRGGSVVTYVRYGAAVASPVSDEAEADYILAFEELEAYRWLPFLKTDGKIIINTQTIPPMPVVTGAEVYPADILTKIKDMGADALPFHALSAAKEAGNIKAVNVCLLGVTARVMDIPKEKWIDALERVVPQRFLEVNKKAFEMGYNN